MAPTRRAGTGFINLSDWAAANATGSQRLADELAGGVDSKGRAAQANLDGLNQDFWERVRGGTQRFDDEGLNSTIASQRAGAQYAGPNGLSDIAGYDSAMSTAQDAGRNANLLSDYYGRQALLDERAGAGGNYTTGQRLLDSALVGGVGGSRFADLKSQWGGLFDRAQGMERDAAGAASEGRRISEESARRYGEAAPVLRRQEFDRARQQQEEVMRRQEEEARANREREEEWNRRNRDTIRDVNRREGLPPGPKGPRRGGAWDI